MTKGKVRIRHHTSRRHLIYCCISCGSDTYILQAQRSDYFLSKGELATDRGLPIHHPPVVLHQWPIATPNLHPSVPQEMRDAAIEAESSLAVGAYNGCGVMARRAISALCQDKKAKGADLHKQLKFLRENGMIAQDLWEWAEDLRILGRSGAHPEWPKVSPGDAQYAVRFLHEIIKYVYINPWERKFRRVKETKGTKNKSGKPAEAGKDSEVDSAAPATPE